MPFLQNIGIAALKRRRIGGYQFAAAVFNHQQQIGVIAAASRKFIAPQLGGFLRSVAVGIRFNAGKAHRFRG